MTTYINRLTEPGEVRYVELKKETVTITTYDKQIITYQIVSEPYEQPVKVVDNGD